MAAAEAPPAAARAQVPGYARDLRQQTAVDAELPFFNDAAMAHGLIESGLDPWLSRFPRVCRIADFGGGDGFLAAAICDRLAGHGIAATALVVDANTASLRVALRRGLRVVPANLEYVRLGTVQLVAMRLVMHYNTLSAQRRILQRAFECLLPRGYLLLQAEAGEPGSALFRNLLARALDRAGPASAAAAGCRWLCTESLARLLRRCGFEILTLRDDRFTFEARLDDLLRLAWTRVHGTPTSSAQSRQRYASFCDYAQSLARRMLQRRSASGLRAGSAGEVRFVSRHAVVVAHRPPGNLP